DADAEPGRSGTSPGARAAAAAGAAASATTAKSAALAVRVAAAVRVDAARHAAREADVGVGAAGLLRFVEADVGQALEHRRPRIALRRLRDQLRDQIRRRDQQSSRAGALQELSTGMGHINSSWPDGSGRPGGPGGSE